MRDREQAQGLKPEQVLQYLELPLRRPWHLLVPLVLITAAALGASYLVSPRYESSTLVMVEAEKIPDSFVEKTTVEKPKRLLTVRQEVLSRTRLERILQELNPYPQAAGSAPLTSLVEQMRNATDITVKGDDAFVIAYTHRDPRKAMEVTGRLASLFIEETTRTSERDVTEATRFIESQLTDARGQLEASEEKLRRFKEQHMGSLPEQLPANLAALQRLQLEQQSVGADLQAALSRVGALEGAAATVRTPARETSAELNQLRTELAALRTRYTEEHPDVLALRSRITRLEKQAAETEPGSPVASSAGVSLQQARTEVRALRAREAEAAQRAAVFQARVEQAPRVEQELLALTRDYDKLKENYLALLNKKMAAGMTEKMEQQWKGERFRVLDPADLPDRPVYPRRKRFLLYGLLAGLLVGLGLCVGAEMIDPSLKQPSDIQALVPHPVLVTVPHVRSRLRFARAPREEDEEEAPAGWGALQEPEDLGALVEPIVVPAGALYEREDPLSDLVEESQEPVVEAPPEPVVEAPPEPVVEAPPEPVVEAPPEPVVEPPPPPPPARAEPKSEPEPLPIVPLPVVPLPVREPEPVAPPIAARAPSPEPPRVPPAPPPAPAPAAVPAPPATQPATEMWGAILGHPTEAPHTPPPAPPAPPVALPDPAPIRARARTAARESIRLPTAAPPPPVVEGGGPRLVMAGVAAEGPILTLALDRPESWLGSAPECHLQVERDHVEPRHARVRQQHGEVVIEDAGTIHGTYVNGRRLLADQALRDGDWVYLGPPGSRRSARLQYLVQAEAAPAPRPALVIPPRPAPPAVPLGPEPVRARPAAARRRPAVSLPVPARLLAAAAAVLAVLGLAAWAAVRLLRTPPPDVMTVEPTRMEPGRPLTLVGSGFAEDAAANQVRLGDRVVKVDVASDARISLTVPEDLAAAGGGPLTLIVESAGRASKPFMVALAAPPIIASFEPPVALPGQEVRAHGRQLGRDDLAVYVSGVPAELIERQPQWVRLRVPSPLPGVEGQRLPVTVAAGGETGRAAGLVLGHLPVVTEVAPRRGRAGERVSVRGYGFDPTPGASVVEMGGRPALVLSLSPTELVVAAPPAGALAGEVAVDVVVTVLGRPSTSEATYTVVRPPADIFRPRFYPAPVVEHPGHDHVFVSTELGPVLLLTGPAEGQNTAERAARAAGALNELMEAAAKPLALELRERPAPAVGLAGGQNLLVTATAQDAAGYAEVWEPDVLPARVGPRSLARFWTALLQDHLSLFALRTRPTRVLEVSARGQVLSDLYAAAVRRAGVKAGVPASLLSPLSPNLAKGLRDLALLVPPEGQPAVGAAVVGRWEGTMEERDVGARPLKLRLFMAGPRLAGIVTMGAGKLTVEAPLRDLQYADGSLRFTLPVGAAPLHFQGTVRDETLDGLIQAGPTTRDARGFFSLRYSQ